MHIQVLESEGVSHRDTKTTIWTVRYDGGKTAFLLPEWKMEKSGNQEKDCQENVI